MTVALGWGSLAIDSSGNLYGTTRAGGAACYTSCGGISLDHSMPGAVKFVMPTVAEGSIFIAGGSGYPNFYFDTNTGNPCPSGTGLACAGGVDYPTLKGDDVCPVHADEPME